MERGTNRETIIPLTLGTLDPVDTIPGLKERLHNLGIGPGEIDERETPALGDAIRQFQERHGLDMTGTADQQTKDVLRDAYGA